MTKWKKERGTEGADRELPWRQESPCRPRVLARRAQCLVWWKQSKATAGRHTPSALGSGRVSLTKHREAASSYSHN